MVGEQAAQDMELASASNTPEHANEAFVALMKTIRSDIVEALQFVDQQFVQLNNQLHKYFRPYQ